MFRTTTQAVAAVWVETFKGSSKRVSGVKKKLEIIGLLLCSIGSVYSLVAGLKKSRH